MNNILQKVKVALELVENDSKNKIFIKELRLSTILNLDRELKVDNKNRNIQNKNYRRFIK